MSYTYNLFFREESNKINHISKSSVEDIGRMLTIFQKDLQFDLAIFDKLGIYILTNDERGSPCYSLAAAITPPTPSHWLVRKRPISPPHGPLLFLQVEVCTRLCVGIGHPSDICHFRNRTPSIKCFINSTRSKMVNGSA